MRILCISGGWGVISYARAGLRAEQEVQRGAGCFYSPLSEPSTAAETGGSLASPCRARAAFYAAGVLVSRPALARRAGDRAKLARRSDRGRLSLG